MSTPKEKRTVSPVVKIYLIGYNALQFLGWLCVLAVIVKHVANDGLTNDNLWEHIHKPLIIFQTGAVFEIIHSLIGIVPSSVGVTLPQVFSRLFVLWPVLVAVPASRDPIGLPLLLLAWVITEVMRYLFYTLGLFSMVPGLLQWCRYSFFLVLYPAGITGELLCCYRSLPHYDVTQEYSVLLPNKFNFTFNFYYFIVTFMLFYIPVFPQLYGHMLSQRRKILGGRTAVKQD